MTLWPPLQAYAHSTQALRASSEAGPLFPRAKLPTRVFARGRSRHAFFPIKLATVFLYGSMFEVARFVLPRWCFGHQSGDRVGACAMSTVTTFVRPTTTHCEKKLKGPHPKTSTCFSNRRQVKKARMAKTSTTYPTLDVQLRRQLRILRMSPSLPSPILLSCVIRSRTMKNIKTSCQNKLLQSSLRLHKQLDSG